MTDRPPTMNREQAAARRRAVRRTVAVLVVVALAIYVFALAGGSLPGATQ
jgi:hypothetical protein